MAHTIHHWPTMTIHLAITENREGALSQIARSCMWAHLAFNIPIIWCGFFTLRTRLSTPNLRTPPTQGRFTLWTMKSDHGRWPLSMVWVHRPTSIVRLHKKNSFESLGPLTRCKPNVDQEEWPCTKKWMCWILIHAQKGDLWKKIQVWPYSCLLLGFICLHFLLNVSRDVACKSSHNNFYKKEWVI